jgi:8-oxo-dGTP diphosphatase
LKAETEGAAPEYHEEQSMARTEYPDSPRVGVGAVVLREGRILLVRRGVPPALGLWAIPGGVLKLGESLKEGAEREILEETGITIRAGDPVFTCDFCQRDGDGRIRFHYVIVDLAAEYVSGKVRGGDDALEARWVAPEEIEDLPATKTTLKLLRQIGFLSPPEPPEVTESGDSFNTVRHLICYD